jgi:N-acetylgalactosamine kinase
MSGGMDQAICLLARPGSALRIDFDPLRTRPVAVPAAGAIVVCNSLVVAVKAGAGRAADNQRVTECRQGCRALARALRVDDAVPHLGALRRLVPERATDELLAMLGGATGDLDAVVVARVRHVLREADRVDAAEAVLQRGDWRAFGELMNTSHASCREDYAISCPDLEELVRVARAAGAVGARLTGAGFGGCTVNLVPQEEVASFLDRIDWDYYRPRGVIDGRNHCWVFAPSGAAAVYA